MGAPDNERTPGPKTEGSIVRSNGPEGSARNRIASKGAVEKLERCRRERALARKGLEVATQIMREINAETIKAASYARDEGMGAQEIADVLGVSRQFLYQLAARSQKDG